MKKFPDNAVAILFSGGDSPGMNSLLRAVSRLGLNRHGVEVLGIREGYRGLLRAARQCNGDEKALHCMKQEIADRRGLQGLHSPGQDIVWLDHAVCSGIAGMGGTILCSARCDEFKKSEKARAEVIAFLKALGIRALIVCGGDGSLRGAECLEREGGIRVIGIPCTIDNDLLFTDMSIGVHTAVGTLVWAVDHIKDTARAHRRVMILETMGAKRGELALRAALASGAEMIITPEQGLLTIERMTKMARDIEEGMIGGRSHCIVLVAEGVEIEGDASADSHIKKRNRAYVINDIFNAHFQREGGPFREVLEVRPSVLGHLQRGGHPTASDCILAARFAELAWHSIMDRNEGSGITALRNNKPELVGLTAGPMPERAELVESFTRLHEALSSW